MCIDNQSSYRSQAGDHLRAASGTPLAMAGEEKQKVELVKVDVILYKQDCKFLLTTQYKVQT